MYNSVISKFTVYWTPYLHFFEVNYRSIMCMSTGDLMVVNMKNNFFWDISSWFLTSTNTGVSCREEETVISCKTPSSKQ